MDAPTKQDLIELARTDLHEFLNQFFTGAGYENYDSQIDAWESNELEFNGLTATCVYAEGGNEGGGEHVERVYAVLDGSNVIAHFRFTGFYQSYNGTEWNDVFERVEPREVVVTQYFTA